MMVNVNDALIDIDENLHLEGFGSFLAEYVENYSVSLAVTIILTTVYTVFYFSNIFMIRHMNKIIEFNNTLEEEKFIENSIMTNNEILLN